MSKVLPILILFFPFILIGQVDIAPDSLSNAIQDTLLPADSLAPGDTLSEKSQRLIQVSDSIRAAGRSTGIDTTVVYQAGDTIAFSFKSQKMRLRGESEVELQNQKLNAEIIEITFSNSILDAEGVKDTNGVIKGFPKFNDKGEEFAGERIRYNIQTQKGTISMGETQTGGGFYYGENIKKMDEEVLFVDDGYYTTCDLPDPHYHFGSDEMKVIANKKVFLDPIVFYVEDLPVFIMPFGLYFPNNQGRQSGIIVPSFFFTNNRGVVFNDLGYYWAASDYWDAQFKADIYTKGGFMLKNQTRWEVKNKFSGNAQLEYGRTRVDVDDPYTENFKVVLNHNHTLTPYQNIVMNLNFSSANFNRNTISNSYDQFIQQEITSNASYSRTFDDQSRLSVSYGRSQNIIDETYSQNMNASYYLPRKKPLSSFNFLPKSLRNMQFNYNVNGVASDRKNILFNDLIIQDTLGQDTTVTDTTYNNNYQYRIEHRPGLSVSPKFGHFTLTPSVNFSMNQYFRKIDKTYNAADSSVTVDTTNGAFAEYNYGFSLSTQTTLYGIADDQKPFFWLLKPSALGAKAFRHTYNPSLSFSFRPDQSSENLGFYGRYYDEANEREVIYSKYEIDGGGLASRRLSSAISYSDLHTFEAKIAGEDSTKDKNLKLLTIGLSTSYDLARDSLRLNPISMRFNTPALKLVQFSGNASFTPYDEVIDYERDSTTNQLRKTYRQIDQLLIAQGKGIARLTNFSINLSTSFSSDGISLEEENFEEDTLMTEEEYALGSRFGVGNRPRQERDFFGDCSPGQSKVSMPWNVRLGLRYNYRRNSINPDLKNETLMLTVNASMTFARSWQVSTNGSYDFINKEFLIPQINFTKELHCWDFTFTWRPTGGNAGFYLRLGIKASQLRDLQYEKQSSPLLR
jgi:lipopolysaccharide assembly outer membrane protein LptD (OstA)